MDAMCRMDWGGDKGDMERREGGGEDLVSLGHGREGGDGREIETLWC
jgi:hypothetical protein